MNTLLFTQALALSCLIAIVVGFIFWGGFICGRLWQARAEETITKDE